LGGKLPRTAETRPDQFGSAPDILAPNIDKHFLEAGSAMQHSCVQIAVCGPSRASILTGRRPDTTTAGISGVLPGLIDRQGWC
jgi:arylsulfatase A-like enzyme